MSTQKEKKTKYQYLVGNIALFSVSNFVSKILVFLLVPLYTNVLTTAEYGIADIMQVTLLLLVPALTLNMGEAALRFGIEKTESRGSIFRTGMKFVLLADVLVTCIALVSGMFVPDSIRWYVLLFAVLYICNCAFEFLILYFQGCELVPIVVIGSVTSTVVMIISNIIFLLVIRIGLNGYIYSQIIAYAVASMVMLLLGKSANGDMSYQKDAALEKEMVSYGVPMIAYSTGSFINNAADRYIVAGICGSAVNGIYGVAYKIPAILMVFQRIFAQAWQMSATKSYTDEKSKEFFSGMYKGYNTFMVIGCSVLIAFVRLIAWFMFKKEFYVAWMCVPYLLISVIFGALTGFLGSICLAHKDSKSMGIATFTGAIINVLLNFILVPRFEALGAAFATAVSYAVMCAFAFFFVRKHVKLDGRFIRDIASYIVLFIEAVIMIKEVRFCYAYSVAIIVILVVMYAKDISEIIKSILEGLRSRKKA